jgi:hypothetical protein
MRAIFLWAVGNLAWTLLIYASTVAYSRFKKLPTDIMLNILGALLTTGAALATVHWATSLLIRARTDTVWYYVGIAWLAAGGAAACGLLLVLITSLLGDLREDSRLEQFFRPFYVAVYVFSGLSISIGLLGLFLPSRCFTRH